MNTAPTLEPAQRDPAEIAPTDRYRPDDPVWVFRGGHWCAGVIQAASTGAATVRYRPANLRGTCVDTITAIDVQPRSEDDPLLDCYRPLTEERR